MDITKPVVIYLVISIILIAIKLFGLPVSWWLIIPTIILTPVLFVLYWFVRFIAGLPK